MSLRCFLFASDEGASDVIRQVLTGLDVEGETCPTATTAVDRVAHEPFQLVIIDWDQQPEAGMILTATREHKPAERPLTLAIVSDDSSVPKALQAGANSILRKPLVASQVTDTLTTARDLIRSQARRPVNPLQASINTSDDESGEFIDLMEAASSLPGEPMEREELQQQVQKTVMAMPDHLREILLLSYFHQFPYKQIGDILDIPLGTVKSRLHAAVAYFADRWRAMNQGRLAS